jgi:uncharacterized protein YcbK (DUF882 family)
MMGNAVDWYTLDYPLDKIAEMLVNWSGGFHFYKEYKFIHTDIGLRRRW